MERETKIEKSFEYKGRKCVILWVGSHFCAYVETKLNDVSYSQEFGSFDTSPCSNVECHGGITFGASTLGEDTPFDKNIQYFGMDFAHSGDYMSYYDDDRFKDLYKYHKNDHRWTLNEVEEETKKFCDSLLEYEKVYWKYKEKFDKFQEEINDIKGTDSKDKASGSNK